MDKKRIVAGTVVFLILAALVYLQYRHWQSFDSALPGFDAGHIALSTGDGDPWRFFAGMDTLGRMRIDRIEAMQGSN